MTNEITVVCLLVLIVLVGLLVVNAYDIDLTIDEEMGKTLWIIWGGILVFTGVMIGVTASGSRKDQDRIMSVVLIVAGIAVLGGVLL